MKENSLAADRQILNQVHPNAVNPSRMDTAAAGTYRGQPFNLFNDKMKTVAVIVDHVGHFIVWNVKELCDSV